jgi:hypothetical protein
MFDAMRDGLAELVDELEWLAWNLGFELDLLVWRIGSRLKMHARYIRNELNWLAWEIGFKLRNYAWYCIARLSLLAWYPKNKLKRAKVCKPLGNEEACMVVCEQLLSVITGKTSTISYPPSGT